MRKISYLLMPLLVFPIFTSCNNKVTSKISNQSELITAVSFSNCKYVQATGNKAEFSVIVECSPTVSHTIFGKTEIYDDGHYSYVYDEKQKCWEKDVDDEGEFFYEPKDIYFDIFSIVVYFQGDFFIEPIVYDDLKYENNEYVCAKQDKDGIEYNVTIKFSNKELTYLDISGGEERHTYSFSYKHTTPKLPM